MKEELETCLGKPLVVDTDSDWVFLGVLDRISPGCLTLRDADAHDISDTEASKERYIFDARTNGIKVNRDLVHIRLDAVVSFSPLDAVKEF